MQQFTITPDTVEEMIAAVQRTPGYEPWAGCSDSRFQQEEVEWKRAASEKVQELMRDAKIPASFDTADDVDAFVKVLETGFASTHMLASPVGDMGVANLKALSAEQRRPFCLAMRDLLFGDGSTPERLDRFQMATQDFGIKNPWAFATHFLFFLYPDRELLVRPQSIYKLLQKLGLGDAWSDKPNGPSYTTIVAVAQALLTALRPYGAQDMIDVQSFVWLWWRAPAVPPLPATRRSWVFQSVPEAYDLQGAVNTLPRIAWRVRQHPKEIHPGDEVFLWESGTAAAIHAAAEVETEPAVVPAVPEEQEFIRDPKLSETDDPCVWLRITRIVAPPVERSVLRADPLVGGLPVFKGMTGTNFPLTPEQAEALRGLIAARPPVSNPETPPGFSDLLGALREQRFYFPPEAVANYLLALQTKRFVILSGISGTGKTKLAHEIARCCANGAQVQIVPVRPDWTDKRGLLGYYNPLTQQYVTTDFLELLRAANADPGRPYFVILDEMNLARVEHYFSDFLSCLESEKPIPLHDQGDPVPVSRSGAEPMPDTLRIPDNVFFTGTVNVDETTYMFSPKVIDRAFTIELNEVRLDCLDGGDAAGGCPLPLTKWKGDLVFGGNPDAGDWKKLGEAERETLLALHALLEKHNRHFGYRVACEIARFVCLAEEQAGPDGVQDALDLAILQKVLPKFHGTRAELSDVLKEVFSFAIAGKAGAEHDWTHWRAAAGSLQYIGPTKAPGTIAPKGDDGDADQTTADGTQGTDDTSGGSKAAPVVMPALPRTARKAWRMLDRLQKQGFTAYME